MRSGEIDNRRAKPPRVRASAHWCLVLSALTLAACGIGIFQMLTAGVVTIRPGYEYQAGGAAENMLAAVGVVGAVFGVIGLIMLHRARQLSDQLRDT